MSSSLKPMVAVGKFLPGRHNGDPGPIRTRAIARYHVAAPVGLAPDLPVAERDLPALRGQQQNMSRLVNWKHHSPTSSNSSSSNSSNEDESEPEESIKGPDKSVYDL